VAIRQKKRKMALIRSGLSGNDQRQEVRICDIHPIQRETVRVQYLTEKGKMKIIRKIMYLPSNRVVRRESSSSFDGSTRGLGVGVDREIATTIQESSPEVITAALRLVGLWHGQGLVSPVDIPQNLIINNNNNNNIPTTPLTTERIRVVYKDETKTISEVRIQMESLDDAKIKYQTGFPSLLALLSFIAIACQGDINTITTSSSELTWFEERYLFIETIYGRTMLRWIDAKFKYNMSCSTLRDVYDRKLELIKRVRRQWPTYASLDEDETYRKDFKWEAYLGRRVVMYDNTNIRMMQPSDAETQRVTYSLYYSGNVGKGAVFIQPCGWMGSHEIWTGGVSDTHYMQNAKVFDCLNRYLRTSDLEDDVSRSLEITIILDRGYRITADALASGGHYTLQPIFAPSERQFNTVQTSLSSSVATDRSGNERAVRYLKISEYISRGRLCAESPVRLSETWLVWGFQVNFMYRPVL
jgi:hypothetical protein